MGVLHAALGEDHVLLVRLHPFVRSRTTIGPELEGFAIDVSDYADINELMLVSDVLVTDYSSAIYEFALLDRPTVFFAPDYEAYERERGFYFDYRTGVPGPIFETTEALAAYLRAGVFDLERVERFRRASFEIADGRSTARVTDSLIVPSLTGSRSRP
jgi:CDP-ribitol ribitolphosphotransferase